MNETVQMKLKVIVERAVRPVKASLACKMKMREELLAHITAVFDDELPRCGDETTALYQAEKRFGDPSELSQTLQKSLPASESFAPLIDGLLEPRTGESWLQQTVRYGSLMMAEVGLLFVLSLISGKFMPLQSVCILMSFAVFLSGMISIVSVLSNRLQQALFTTEDRSVFKVTVLLIVSCFVPVFLPVAYTVIMSPFISFSDGINLGLRIMRILLPAAPMGPLIVILAAKMISDGKRYREEWAKLQID